MNRFCNYIFILFYFSSYYLTAQELIFENRSKAFNLPSLETYSVFQDSKGYIWFSTELGLYKYNGRTVFTIDLKNPKNHESVYSIYENKNGTIGVVTSKNRFLQIIDDQAYELNYSNKVIKTINDPRKIIYLVNTDEKSNTVFHTQYMSYSINHKSNQIELVKHSSDKANFKIVANQNSCYFLKTNQIVTNKIKQNKHIASIEIQTDYTNKRIEIPFDKRLDLIDSRNRILKINNTIFFNISNRLIKIDRHGTVEIKLFPSTILSLNSDKKNGLWVGLQKNGVYYYSNCNDLSKVQKNLNTFSVTSTLEDFEGGFWCSTLEKGLFYCKNKSIKYYPKLLEFKTNSDFLKTIDNTIYLSKGSDEIVTFSNDKIVENHLNLSNGSEITDLIKLKNNYVICNKGYIAISNKTNKLSEFKKLIYQNYNICTYKIDTLQNRVFFLSANKIFELKNNLVYELYENLKINGRDFTTFDTSKLVIGCKDGLYCFDILTKTFSKYNNFHAEVTKVFKDNENTIWIATKGEGLHVLKNNRIEKIFLDNTSKNDCFQDISQDNQNIIWATSNSGLYKIFKYKSFEKINSSNGLLASNCNKIVVNNNTIFVSTIDGLCSFSSNSIFKNNSPPVLYLKKININEIFKSSNSSYLNLKHNENNIRFLFDVLSYRNQSRLVYKLIGYNKKFVSTSENEISFENLLPKNYNLIVYAENSDHVRTKKALQIRFTIECPYWESWWFLLILLALFSLLFFLIQKRIIRNIQRKEEEKAKINNLISESQLMALQSQMNPHFIFNSINSIQSYILKNEKEEAYNYLAKFSKLIRKVLNNSIEKTISLKEELETLELYVALEQMRFKETFLFVVNIDKHIDLEEYYIPSMLIQPFVENAIWHGLMNKEEQKKGVLKLLFKKEHSLIKIIIEDNGIGREAAEKQKDKNTHKPLSTLLNEQRIKLLNNIEDFQNLKITTEDLKDNENLVVGTRVIVELPLNIF